MSLLEFLVTYLAIGAAFAMRAYFRSRHRPAVFVFRAVASELVFWLPKWIVVSIRHLLFSHGGADTNPVRQSVAEALYYEARIDELVESLDSTESGKRVRETAEMYVALRTALIAAETDSKPAGQFELFQIAGQLNGQAGSACLFRKNLEKLRRHSQQAADDLVRLISGQEQARSSPGTAACLIDLFRECDDPESIAKASRTDSRTHSGRAAISEEFAAETV